MTNIISMAFVLGISAGVTPGPLFAFVISETLRYGPRAGVLAALAPLLTDLPIVLISIFLLSYFAQHEGVLGIISILGAVFVAYLGWQNICFKNEDNSLKQRKATSFKKALLVNLLSPHPYLFWITVGAPAVVSAYRQNYALAFAFIGIFYLLLVGAKIILALVTARSKCFMSGKVYIFIMKILGFVLFSLSLILFIDGLKLLKIL